MSERTTRLALLFALFVSLESPAFAYLDPATGSIIIQAIIGAVGSWFVYSRLFMSRTKSVIKGLFSKGTSTSGEE
jgi:hypothetical protein